MAALLTVGPRECFGLAIVAPRRLPEIRIELDALVGLIGGHNPDGHPSARHSRIERQRSIH